MKRKITALAVTFVIALSCFACGLQGMREDKELEAQWDSRHKEMMMTMRFSSILAEPPFKATVSSKYINRVRDRENMEVVIIYVILRRDDNVAFSIHAIPATEVELEIAEHLEIGATYQFPDVLQSR